jgi:hypothetical protein
MTKRSLDPRRFRLVEIIEELVFGRIEKLSIVDGEPSYERAFQIVQEIKLGSLPQRRPDDGDSDLTLKKEFEDLFSELSRLRDGVVDIEVRHATPFKLVLERCCADVVRLEAGTAVTPSAAPEGITVRA